MSCTGVLGSNCLTSLNWMNVENQIVSYSSLFGLGVQMTVLCLLGRVQLNNKMCFPDYT